MIRYPFFVRRGGASFLIVAICLFFFSVSSGVAGAGAEAIAVVVHPEAPVNNLSLEEVRHLFLGDRQFWSSDLRVVLLLPAPGLRERAVLLQAVYEMSEPQFNQYWISKLFRGEISAEPKTTSSSEMALGLVQKIPGSIAFVNAALVTPEVKVLRINGYLPVEGGYPFR